MHSLMFKVRGLTIIGFLSRMAPLVLNQNRILTEGLPTVITFIGSFPSMDSLMSDKVCLANEAFPTVSTFMRLLPSVDPLVLSKIDPTVLYLCTFLLLPIFSCSSFPSQKFPFLI